MRRDVGMFPAFKQGPPEFYERAVIEHRAPLPAEPEPAAPARRPGNFVRCLPAFEIRAVPVTR